MSRNYPMTGIRMPPELKARLANAASSSGRSLNMEIVQRLASSLEQKPARAARFELAEPSGTYGEKLSDSDRDMLVVFRRLPLEKQMALLMLFK